MSVREARTHAIDRLEVAGCASPRADAEFLLEHALSRSRSELYAAPEQVLEEDERIVFEQMLARRCLREPLAYILGEWGFRRLRLRVTPDVLVPRPETELLVDRCLAHLRDTSSPRVLDIGTGSGAIAVAIADEHRGAEVTAVDVSEAALRVAAANALRAAVDDRISLVQGDLFAGQPGPFELVVSNPPYVSTQEYAELAPEVARFEPRLALVGSGFHTRITQHAPRVLAPDGWLAMEIGEDQGSETIGLFATPPWTGVRVIEDLNERPRIVEARLAPTPGGSA